MAGDLAAPYLTLVTAWEAERAGLVRAYEEAIASRSTPTLLRAIDAASGRVEHTLTIVRPQMRLGIVRIEQWHRVQWLSRVRASTGLEVAMLTTADDVAPEIDAATAWNEQLADDVHAQTKQRIVTALVGGAAVLTPATAAEAKRRVAARRALREAEPDAVPEIDPPAQSIDEMIQEAVARAKRRARNIGVDQAEKTSASLTRARRIAAGVSTWRWRHHDPQPHPRIEHIRRDGKVYSDARPPKTMPGEEPYCKCWEEPILR